ncbi:Alpha-methylacyl-CoA racemase [Purpureocillium takamizusanense]|uniref:Alpha-methylacyl-CoA racemase n=1 Tax=Purpureocillium takamizusanense TaxID=2060973 RepID=A0A9Q8VA46_9HYPO|nr:Alpha-methylacyl-CoA racemase [Purpureocillium takamizusanense]UNI18995.1 Alpha-methylacyl-CoA racemase [Purpureocillium takamizusanense]
MAAAGPPPLAGIKVLEFAGLAPGPFCGMLLADAGASVLRIDRAPRGGSSSSGSTPQDWLTRHKASLAVDLKSPRGIRLVRALVARGADVLIDPFRPGVLERLGLGPDDLLPLNPRLVYGRLTGYRRDGRYRDMAGHDINYLAVSGALSLLGRDAEIPHPPVNLLADFAGGGATLFQGVLLALLSRASTGRGQVVEANMVDGASYLATFPRFMLKTPLGALGRGRNLLDGGCPYYDTYATKDEGRYVSVGALEPQFFAALLRGLHLEGQGWESRRYDPDEWPALRRVLADVFRTKTRTEWERVFDGTDACVAPILEYGELETDPAREGDQRPAVTLRGTPCLAVKQQGDAPGDPAIYGQGRGVPGDGYEGAALAPGEGAEDVLRGWFGWAKGKDYNVSDGAFELVNSDSKL